MKNLFVFTLNALLVLTAIATQTQYSLNGTVTAQSLSVTDARVTLFNSDTTFFLEKRTNIIGNYTLFGTPSGSYTFGRCEIKDIKIHILEMRC